MNVTDLPMLIASGILIAAMILFAIRSAFVFWHRGEHGVAVALGAVFSGLGGVIILAGLGFIPW